jgi:hypothetical protein
MPRRTRTQLLDYDEDRTCREREEGYQRLEIRLHSEWRHGRSIGAIPEVGTYLTVLCNERTLFP